MPSLNTIVPAKPPLHRARRHTVTPPPPPPPVVRPVLTEASFAAEDGVLTVFFDTDVQVVGFDPAGIVVNVPDRDATYAATGGAGVVSGFIVTVTAEVGGPAVGPDPTVTAGPATGIASADTGAVWAGVTDFPLDPSDARPAGARRAGRRGVGGRKGAA